MEKASNENEPRSEEKNVNKSVVSDHPNNCSPSSRGPAQHPPPKPGQGCGHTLLSSGGPGRWTLQVTWWPLNTAGA